LPSEEDPRLVAGLEGVPKAAPMAEAGSDAGGRQSGVPRGKLVYRLVMAALLALAVYVQGPDGGWKSETRPVMPVVVLTLIFGWALWPRNRVKSRRVRAG
jgi:hypothetical protein